MPSIKLLSKELYELIAAGEVIERPASVIKELVENSVDAGAEHITVEIKDGGITYMRVTDDGCGMSFDEVPTAFLRHATSKINSKDDLDESRIPSIYWIISAMKSSFILLWDWIFSSCLE